LIYIGLIFDFGNVRRVGNAHRIRVLVGNGFGGQCPPYLKFFKYHL